MSEVPLYSAIAAVSYERGTPVSYERGTPAFLMSEVPLYFVIAAGPPVCISISACKREFKLPWREAGPPNHHDDEVVSDQ